MPRFLIFTIITFLLLTACGPVPAEGPAIPTATSASTFTPIPPAQTALPTETPSPTPIPTVLPSFPLDGYILVFRQDGDLYFQDGNNEPIQLTHGGEETHFIAISDDNKKIVFARGDYSFEEYSNIHSVNPDGSGEQEFITPQLLASLGEGTRIQYPIFVPGTHQLLFNTHRCGMLENRSACSIGLYLVNADTGEIKKIVSPGPLAQYDAYNSNFKVSPDGKKVSVVMSGYIDIFDLDGNVIRHNVLPYTPSTPVELFPVQYWLPDSNGLIVALPDTTEFGWAFPQFPNYTLMQYVIDEDKVIQIPLNPSIRLTYRECGDVIRVSPNGEWFLYDANVDVSEETWFRLVNRNNGNVQALVGGICALPSSPWNPTSEYFVYRNSLGFVNGTSIQLGIDYRGSMKWIDANHYTYVVDEENILKLRVGEIVGDEILTYDIAPVLLIKPK